MSLTLQLSEIQRGRSDPPASERWASEGSGPKDWEAQRPYIEKLYKDKTLKEIVELMKVERNFKATPRMYKARIKQWGLRKYQVGDASRTAASKTSPRKCSKENSILEKNSKVINGAKIQRSGKSSTMASIPKDKLEEALHERSSSVVPYIGSPSGIRPPEQFRSLEFMLDNIDTYIRGSFENGTWQAGKPTQSVGSVKERTEQPYYSVFQYSVWTAFSLFRAGDLRGTEKTWSTISALITDVVRSENVRIWDGICNIVVDLHHEGWLEVGREISRQCSRVAAVLYGPYHPLHLLFDWLAKLSPSDLEPTAGLCWQRAGDVFEDILGPSHFTVVAERSRSLRMLQYATDMQSNIDAHKKLLKQCETSWSCIDPRTVLVHHDYANLLLKCGLEPQAIQEAEIILDQLKLGQPGHASTIMPQAAGHSVDSPSAPTSPQGTDSATARKQSVTLSFTWLNTPQTGTLLKLEEHLRQAEKLLEETQARERERTLSAHELRDAPDGRAAVTVNSQPG